MQFLLWIHYPKRCDNIYFTNLMWWIFLHHAGLCTFHLFWVGVLEIDYLAYQSVYLPFVFWAGVHWFFWNQHTFSILGLHQVLTSWVPLLLGWPKGWCSFWWLPHIQVSRFLVEPSCNAWEVRCMVFGILGDYHLCRHALWLGLYAQCPGYLLKKPLGDSSWVFWTSLWFLEISLDPSAPHGGVL